MHIPARSGKRLDGSDTDPTIFMERPPLDMPLDLAAWVAPQKIGQWIQEVIEKLDISMPGVQEFSSLRPEDRPGVLLAVLLFAYATERFMSSEIFGACHSDPVLQSMCEGKAPFPDEIEHFRRKNRLLLEGLLGNLLERAVREKFLPASRLPPGLQDSLRKRAVDQIDTARHMSTLDTQ